MNQESFGDFANRPLGAFHFVYLAVAYTPRVGRTFIYEAGCRTKLAMPSTCGTILSSCAAASVQEPVRMMVPLLID